ncbi:hypothetical protein NQ176_g8258 [Zarea fungicola]|uniref:Uncharacterized protein n=1 Tax=Zarea fungicola TaxID=93591 RepID=A0ACC1MTG4_9HYPO|nr:hypothetical protein NQ176_g8258 [Lecanicillium fungicola]
MADEAGKNGPTATEGVFFFNIVKHMKNKAEIDWDAVAESTGFKNAGVAKVWPISDKFSAASFNLLSSPPVFFSNFHDRFYLRYSTAVVTNYFSIIPSQVRFGQIKRKYGLDSDSPTKKTKKTDESAANTTTPTKVTKARRGGGNGRGRGRVPKKEEPEADEEDKASLTNIKPMEVKGEYKQSVAVKEELPIDEFSYF